MNVIIEYSKFSKFKKIYNKVTEAYKNKEIHFIVFFEKGVSIRPYYFLKKRRYRNIGYVANCNYRLSRLIKLSKLKKRPLKLTLTLNKDAKKYINRLNKLKYITRIYDKSNIDTNYELLSKNDYLLIKDNNHDDIFDYDMLNLYIFGNTIYQCNSSSCLGNILYINKKGIASYCPFHKDESILGNIYETTNIFDDKDFDSFVGKAVEKRNNCKSNCSNYDKCMGGCFFEEDCTDIKNTLIKAIKTYEYISNVKSLDELPYKYKHIKIRDISQEHKF